MLTCFIDESGCPGPLPTISSAVQPILVIAGIALDTSAITTVTRQFARLVQRYRHGESRPNDICTDLLGELIKGAEVRKAFRTDPAAAERREFPFIDSVLTLLRTHEAKLYGTVIVKAAGEEFDGRRAYSQALSTIAKEFHRTLEAAETQGTAIADFRESKLNGRVSTDLMEAKLGPAGDQLPRLLYPPTFGNSEVHAPLQLVDLVCSAMLWPIAAWHFRERLDGSPHIAPAADVCIRRRFRRRLREVVPRYPGVEGASPGCWPHHATAIRSSLVVLLCRRCPESLGSVRLLRPALGLSRCRCQAGIPALTRRCSTAFARALIAATAAPSASTSAVNSSGGGSTGGASAPPSCVKFEQRVIPS